jgi:hypothetical protein
MGTPPARAPDQYRRLTHAHAAATEVTRQGAPEPVYNTASNGPRANGHDRRQPPRACTFRLRTASQTPQTTPARYGPHAPTAGRDPVPSPHGRATQWLMISITGVGKPANLKGPRRVRAKSGSYLDDVAPGASEPPLARRSLGGGRGSRSDFVSCCLPAAGRQRGFSSMFRLVVHDLRERMPVSRASRASQAPGPARRAAVRRSRGCSRWQTLQAPGRHPPEVRRSPASGNCPVAAPRSRQAQLLLGWPISKDSPSAAVVSALPWA